MTDGGAHGKWTRFAGWGGVTSGEAEWPSGNMQTKGVSGEANLKFINVWEVIGVMGTNE